MRNKLFFLLIGILILSTICVYALVHTKSATVPEHKEAHAVKTPVKAANSQVKTKDCNCCDRMNKVRQRVQERLKKKQQQAQQAETPAASQQTP